MNPLVRYVLLLALAWSCQSLHAVEIIKSDGQVYTSSSIRRSGAMVMIKITTPEGGMIEMGIPATSITKVVLPEPPELTKALTAAASSSASEVITLTGDYVAKQAEFKDLPGSWWPEMARLRLLALAGTGKDADAATLAREVGAINTTDAGVLSRGGTLLANLQSGDNEAVVVGAKSLPRIGGGQGAALAQLALGRALLAKKDYQGALRAFLTIKVFYPSAALIQPAARIGAGQAYIGLKDEKRAVQSFREVSESYPASPLVPEAKKLADSLSKS